VRLARNAALLLASLLVSIGAAELAVRFAFRDVTTTTPIDSWFGERWKNQHLRRFRGYRERPFTWQRAPGERRIALIGDSFSVAMGLPEAERFGNRIEAALSGPDGGFRVLHLARPGQEIHGHLATLREDALRADPDFVLLQFYANDVEVSKRGKPRSRPLLGFTALHASLYRHSALYLLASAGWDAFQVRAGLVEDWPAYLHRRYGDPDGDSALAMALLREFFDTCRAAGKPVAVVLFPVLSAQLGPDDPFGFLYDRVLTECAAAGVACVDLRPVFAPFAGEFERLRLNRFDHHASAFAHALAAQALLDALGPTWRALPVREPQAAGRLPMSRSDSLRFSMPTKPSPPV
jgi:hypothetical protein